MLALGVRLSVLLCVLGRCAVSAVVPSPHIALALRPLFGSTFDVFVQLFGSRGDLGLGFDHEICGILGCFVGFNICLILPELVTLEFCQRIQGMSQS